MPLKLPPVVTRFIDGSLLIRDDIGESPCEVYSFNRGNDRFLSISFVNKTGRS
ncbi:hypothetical protein L7G72_12115 [Xenorhabdus bovienii]|uniref:hypothetical protein n=1 Tax=Xenorhabdus bovienii TaxID=40576 RepID=UPI001EE001C7|nr:hypothetical protein [Xenorhabdus bovienii]MCG3462585.1 hypothetical protein [Xenorhabdus bovienii]